MIIDISPTFFKKSLTVPKITGWVMFSSTVPNGQISVEQSNKNKQKSLKISILISLLISSSFSKIEIPLWSIYKVK